MKFLASIGAIVLLAPMLFFVAILGIMWRAWWLYPAWDWYLVPLGLPEISFWHFGALLYIILLATTHISTKKDERKEDPASWIILLSWPVLAYFILLWLRGR